MRHVLSGGVHIGGHVLTLRHSCHQWRCDPDVTSDTWISVLQVTVTLEQRCLFACFLPKQPPPGGVSSGCTAGGLSCVLGVQLGLGSGIYPTSDSHVCGDPALVLSPEARRVHHWHAFQRAIRHSIKDQWEMLQNVPVLNVEWWLKRHSSPLHSRCMSMTSIGEEVVCACVCMSDCIPVCLYPGVSVPRCVCTLV